VLPVRALLLLVDAVSIALLVCVMLEVLIHVVIFSESLTNWPRYREVLDHSLLSVALSIDKGIVACLYLESVIVVFELMRLKHLVVHGRAKLHVCCILSLNGMAVVH
jgi:hypothetical protein